MGVIIIEQEETKVKKMRKVLAGMLAATAVLSSTVYTWAAEAKTSYTFTAEKVQIAVGAEAQPILDSLGEADDTRVLNNCANGGKDKVYQYEDFDLYTTQNEAKKTIVQTIVLKDDATTEEGLKLGQTPKEVKAAYPDAVESLGLYTVTLGNSQIIIDCGLKNDKVVDISYEHYVPQK